jgi:hypothetical protein
MNEQNENHQTPHLRQTAVSSRYRLYPIIVGFRCEGYELQKEHKTFFGKVWKPVRGEMGVIRCIASNEKDIIKIAEDFEKMATHLSTIKILELKLL